MKEISWSLGGRNAWLPRFMEKLEGETGDASDRFKRIILLWQERKVVKVRGFLRKCGTNFLVKFND